jgi:hypothetical protein
MQTDSIRQLIYAKRSGKCSGTFFYVIPLFELIGLQQHLYYRRTRALSPWFISTPASKIGHSLLMYSLPVSRFLNDQLVQILFSQGYLLRVMIGIPLSL